MCGTFGVWVVWCVWVFGVCVSPHAKRPPHTKRPPHATTHTRQTPNTPPHATTHTHTKRLAHPSHTTAAHPHTPNDPTQKAKRSSHAKQNLTTLNDLHTESFVCVWGHEIADRGMVCQLSNDQLSIKSASTIHLCCNFETISWKDSHILSHFQIHHGEFDLPALNQEKSPPFYNRFEQVSSQHVKFDS